MSISSDSGGDGGGSASFTLIATPSPVASLAVSVTVAQRGEHGPAHGDDSHRRQCRVHGRRHRDSTDEADGSITATVGGGSGYRVSSSQGGATVSVADNDDGGTSVLSVSGGRAREEEDWLMPFTVRLSPPAAHAVEVTVSTRASKPVSARPSKPRQRQAGTTGQWIRRWCSVRGRRSGLCRFPLRR